MTPTPSRQPTYHFFHVHLQTCRLFERLNAFAENWLGPIPVASQVRCADDATAYLKPYLRETESSDGETSSSDEEEDGPNMEEEDEEGEGEEEVIEVEDHEEDKRLDGWGGRR